MKFKVLTLVFFIASTMLFSCTKECDPPTVTYPIHGLWIGTYSVNGHPELGERYFSFVIKPDGTIIMEGKAENVTGLATGTWTMNGNAFSASYTVITGVPANIGTKQQAAATFDNSGKLTNGVWSNVNTTTAGTFKLDRIN